MKPVRMLELSLSFMHCIQWSGDRPWCMTLHEQCSEMVVENRKSIIVLDAQVARDGKFARSGPLRAGMVLGDVNPRRLNIRLVTCR